MANAMIEGHQPSVPLQQQAPKDIALDIGGKAGIDPADSGRKHLGSIPRLNLRETYTIDVVRGTPPVNARSINLAGGRQFDKPVGLNIGDKTFGGPG